jgi:hypothetical protein
MRRASLLIVAVAGAAWLLPRAAGAEEAPAPARAWYEEITVNAFASASYSYNFNRPPGQTNAYRVFDFDDNSFKVDVVELVAQHAASRPREAGFRADLAFGGSIPGVTASRGLFRDPVTGEAQDVDLQQAFVTYVVPAGPGLRVDAGKFVTPTGAEVIEGYDGWNDNATRSFLFGFAIPFAHTGVRASYTFSPEVSAMAMLVNGWDNATDNNRAKTVGAQVGVTPTPELTVLLTGIAGAEGDGNNGDTRRLGDLVASYKVSPRLTLVLNGDLGSEEGLFQPASTRSAQWSGLAAYARVQASDRFALIARGETFDDRDGVRTGLAQTLRELTLTLEHNIAPHVVLRGDLRFDHSDQDAFPSNSGPKDSQTTVLLNAIAAF